MKYPNIAARILANIVEDDSLDFCRVYGACWLWRLYCHKRSGYAHMTIRVNGKPQGVLVHRALFEILEGVKIPDGMTLDHGCERRACVRPSHLAMVSLSMNTHLMWERRKFSSRSLAYDKIHDSITLWEALKVSEKSSASAPSGGSVPGDVSDVRRLRVHQSRDEAGLASVSVSGLRR